MKRKSKLAVCLTGALSAALILSACGGTGIKSQLKDGAKVFETAYAAMTGSAASQNLTPASSMKDATISLIKNSDLYILDYTGSSSEKLDLYAKDKPVLSELSNSTYVKYETVQTSLAPYAYKFSLLNNKEAIVTATREVLYTGKYLTFFGSLGTVNKDRTAYEIYSLKYYADSSSTQVTEKQVAFNMDAGGQYDPYGPDGDGYFRPRTSGRIY